MRYLIASLGTAPAVLTEALWHLEREAQQPVDRLLCVGTQGAWTEAQKLFEPGGALDRLRHHLGKPQGWMAVGQGFEPRIVPSPDNRSLEEAKAMDQAFRDAVLAAQQAVGPEGQVVACISGGRKTMSSSLQQAMTLLARTQDRAFHVLLRCPAGIEESHITRSGFAFPGDPAHPEAAGVGVDAYEVPLVRLRDVARLNGIELTSPNLVERLQGELEAPRLVLNLSTRYLSRHKGDKLLRFLRLPPQEAILLAAIVQAGGAAEPETLRRAAVSLAQAHESGLGYFSEKAVQGLFRTEEKKHRIAYPDLQVPFSRFRKNFHAALMKWDPRVVPLFETYKGNKKETRLGFRHPVVQDGFLRLGR